MSGTNAQKGTANRPLSPHLSVYKPIPTMVTSILHRITGFALYFGTVFVALWLIAASSSEMYFDYINGILSSWFGRIILLGFTWALVNHVLGGIKHLIQDTGRALEKNFTTKLAIFQLVASVLITVLLWILAYSFR